MHLNLHTDYALRILMLLAATDRQMSVDEIATRYGISRNHLAKVAQKLQSLGHIATTRGRGGGLRLARTPAELNVGMIVRQFESLDGFVECMAPSRNTCPVAGACGLQGALSMAVQDFLRRLDGYTVADMLPGRKRFLDRIGIEPPIEAEASETALS